MRSAGLCTRPADKPAAHLLPQQRREIETDQVVERTARLLRVDQVERQVARLGNGALYLALGDLVEHHALDVLALEIAAFFEQLTQVPGDRSPLDPGRSPDTGTSIS
jgi:hypothetical protein